MNNRIFTYIYRTEKSFSIPHRYIENIVNCNPNSFKLPVCSLYMSCYELVIEKNRQSN